MDTQYLAPPIEPRTLLKIAWAVATRFRRNLPAHIDIEDLVGAAMVRLIGALPRYDPALAAVSTWATMQAHGAIQDHLRLTMFGSRTSGPIPVHSLNMAVEGADADGAYAEVIDLLEDTTDEHAATIDRVAAQQLLEACANHRDRWVLHMLYLDGMTMQEVGDVLSISESRVCQIHARAINRLHIVATGGRYA